MKLYRAAFAGFLFCGSTISATAEVFLIPTYTPPGTASDAGELAGLAPPSRRSTALATYGDAAIGSRKSRSFHGGAPKFVCFDIDAKVDRCPPSHRPAVQSSYVITPAYVSAPTVVGAAPKRSSPLRSPFVSFVLDAYGEVERLLPTEGAR